MRLEYETRAFCGPQSEVSRVKRLGRMGPAWRGGRRRSSSRFLSSRS